jgi:hypothetical protein
MLQRKALARLSRRKEQLVFQNDALRQRLLDDWQQLQSPETWLAEIPGLVRRHPLWFAGLVAAAGTLLVKTLNRPGAFLNGIGRLGTAIPVILAAWKLFRREWRRP